MPLYEYECATDGRFELIRKFSDPPLATCPTCGSPVEKQASAPAIQFKGSGWYITDYARKSSGEGAGKDQGDKEGTKSEAKSDKPSSEKPSAKESATTSTSAPSTSTSAASGGGDTK